MQAFPLPDRAVALEGLVRCRSPSSGESVVPTWVRSVEQWSARPSSCPQWSSWEQTEGGLLAEHRSLSR